MSRRTFWWRRTVLVLAVVTLGFAAYMGSTLAMYLTNPSYGVSMSARAAEWGRDHGLGGFVSWAEQQLYNLSPPRTGGRPEQAAFGKGPDASSLPTGGHLAVPATVDSPAGANLPGEGVWHVAGRVTSTGVPTTYVAYVRPDPIHTSYVATVAWMDTTLLKAQLYSGSQIPGPKPNGQPYQYSAPITATASRTLVDAFNAGFRMPDAHGGYYTDNATIAPWYLRRGAAAAVVYTNGKVSVGMWGRDFQMGPNIASVRENLNLIVDNARAVTGLTNPNYRIWGATLGGSAYVWRSGLGVTANGALVYAAGPTLSIKTLANVLVAAGAVRAMELDINVDWVQFAYFSAANGTSVNGGMGTSLLNGSNGTQAMAGSPSRYFVNWWSRDFYTMSLR